MAVNADLEQIKALLDAKVQAFNSPSFIENDPVCIPHLFQKKEDIEIAGFFAATLAWGNRKSIIANSSDLLARMDNSPHDYIINHSAKDLQRLKKFVHRTFNDKDLLFFVRTLRNIYTKHNGLESAFMAKTPADLKTAIINFRTLFLSVEHLARSEKHISNPAAKSSSKRLCMFLRWMVRKDKHGVDFGIWESLSPALLQLPLDVHTGFVSRELGLLKRKQNDWQAVEEITAVLRTFDPKDPVKYDFALFGLGIEGYFK